MRNNVTDHEGKKYLRTIRDAINGYAVQVDVYSVLEAFGVTCPARAHCIKKLLATGNRGKGSELDDLIGAMAALNRAIDLQEQRETQKNTDNHHTVTCAYPGCTKEFAHIGDHTTTDPKEYE